MLSLSLHSTPERNGLGSYVKFAEGIATHTKDYPDAGMIFYYSDYLPGDDGKVQTQKMLAVELIPGYDTLPTVPARLDLVIAMLRNGASMDEDEAKFILGKLYGGVRVLV